MRLRRRHVCKDHTSVYVGNQLKKVVSVAVVIVDKQSLEWNVHSDQLSLYWVRSNLLACVWVTLACLYSFLWTVPLHAHTDTARTQPEARVSAMSRAYSVVVHVSK